MDLRRRKILYPAELSVNLRREACEREIQSRVRRNEDTQVEHEDGNEDEGKCETEEEGRMLVLEARKGRGKLKESARRSDGTQVRIFT